MINLSQLLLVIGEIGILLPQISADERGWDCMCVYLLSSAV